LGVATAAALSLALGASGSASHAAKAAAFDLPSCYSEQFTTSEGGGSFKARAGGSGAAKGEFNGVNGKGDASFAMSIRVTGNGPGNAAAYSEIPGDMSGSLEVFAHIPGVAHQVHFVGDCLAEAIRDDGDGIEAEFEGHFEHGTNPFCSNCSDLGVVSIQVTSTKSADGSGKVEGFQVGIEHGTTCNEPGGDAFEFNLKSTVVASGSKTKFTRLAPDEVNQSAGRAAVPDPYEEGPNPCKDVYV
jgi:hypothetical protein